MTVQAFPVVPFHTDATGPASMRTHDICNDGEMFQTGSHHDYYHHIVRMENDEFALVRVV